MRTIEARSLFDFNYPAFDQALNLFVMASIYDVTDGNPNLVSTVRMALNPEGVYSGNYEAGADTAYLVIMGVYTDDTYLVVDPTRGAVADNVYAGDLGSTNLGFNYGAFNQASNLHVAGNLYDVTTGTPVFVEQIAMAHVLLGIYFGSAVGVDGKLYSLSKIVYSDVGLTVVDPNWPPGADVFQCFVPPDVQAQIQAALIKAIPSIKSFIRNGLQISARLCQSELASRLSRNSEIKQKIDHQPELRGRLLKC